MLSISIAKIVGTASEGCWSQVHTFKPSLEKLELFGELLFVVRLEKIDADSEEKLDMASVGKELIQRFHEEYYGSEKEVGSTLNHLKKTAEAVVEEFKSMKLEMIAGVVMPTEKLDSLGILYLVSVGPASALIRRGERIYKLLADGSIKSDNQARVVSGFVKEDDVLLFGTGDFFKLVSRDVVEEALGLKSSAETSSFLAPYVHKEDNSGVAAVVGLFESEGATHEVSEGEEMKGRVGGKPLVGVSKNIFGVVGKFVGLFGKFRKRLKVGRREEIVVREGNDKQKRLMYSVAIVLLVLLGVSVVFGWRRRVANQQEERFDAVWEVVEHQHSEAMSLVELNPLRARALLVEAKDLLEEAVSGEKDKYSRRQFTELSTKLEELDGLLEQVSGEHRVEEASIFLDLALVRPDTYGEVLGLHEDKMVVLDRSSGVLLSIDVSKKSAEAVGGGTFLSGSDLATVYAGRGFVVSDSGVVEVSLENKTSALVFEKDPEWGEIVDMEVFGGNIYLLDQSQGEIYRYQGAESGFGSRRRWLGEGVFPDFSGASSMAIDGDIWVLVSDGIKRFRRGAEDSFVISGLDKPLKESISIYTDEESEKLYVLDRGNQRVLVLDKNGEYRAQYLWEGISAVSDMVVSEKEGKILLLSDSVIYEIELRK